MKSKWKGLLLSFSLILVMIILGACSEKAKHDLDAQQLEQASEVSIITIYDLVHLGDEELEARIQELEDDNRHEEASNYRNTLDVKSEAGELSDISFVEIEGTRKEGYLAHLTASGTLRNTDITLGLDKNMVMTTLSFAPKYTLVEYMEKGAMNTLLGMGTVFAVLIFISFLIAQFKHVKILEDALVVWGEKWEKFKQERFAKKKAAQTDAPKEKTAMPQSASANSTSKVADTNSADLTDDTELVAVITAAIAAYTNQSSDGLIVRSIKRVTKRRR